MKKTMSVIIACLIVLSTFGMLIPASAATTTVYLDPATVTSDTCKTVSIMIETDEAAGMGSATMKLVYDPSVVDYNGKVADGDLGGVTINENPDGTLTMTAATGANPGPTGTVKFVDLEFCPVGDPGECSDLDITVTELTDGNVVVVVPDSVIDGKFCVAGDATPKPDITSPANGATISGTVTVNVTDLSGEDDLAYCIIEYLNGSAWNEICNHTAAPYTCDWDTTTVPNGDCTVKATMVDAAGQTGIDTITVTVENHKCGDVNDDGVVDMGDVIELLYHVGSHSGYETIRDVNCDREINMGDVILLLNHVGGSYGVGCCQES